MDDGGENAESKTTSQENSGHDHSETSPSYTEEQVEVVKRSATCIILSYVWECACKSYSSLALVHVYMYMYIVCECFLAPPNFSVFHANNQGSRDKDL